MRRRCPEKLDEHRWLSDSHDGFAQDSVFRPTNYLSPFFPLFNFKNLAELKAQMDTVLLEKSGAGSEPSGFTTDVGRRVRHWTDGLVIGSRIFLSEVMASYKPTATLARHRIARANETADGDLCAWRRVRESVAG
ncbi:MAG: hypothetical protein H7A43_07670 [Verrucomicrobia bacterium]|nr:hypothetical protein [Verrucomicrobiota bacterium]